MASYRAVLFSLQLKRKILKPVSGFKAKDRNLEESICEIKNNDIKDQSQKKYRRKTDNHNILEQGLKY